MGDLQPSLGTTGLPLTASQIYLTKHAARLLAQLAMRSSCTTPISYSYGFVDSFAAEQFAFNPFGVYGPCDKGRMLQNFNLERCGRRNAFDLQFI